MRDVSPEVFEGNNEIYSEDYIFLSKIYAGSRVVYGTSLLKLRKTVRSDQPNRSLPVLLGCLRIVILSEAKPTLHLCSPLHLAS